MFNHNMFFSESGQPAKVSKKIPKIFDGKYYKLLSHQVNSKIKAKCLTCNKQLSGDISSTGNFFTHYECVHSTLLNELRLYTKQKTENPKSSSSKQPKVQLCQKLLMKTYVCNY